MASIVEDSNEKHMVPWADACQKDDIENTPLSPFLDQVIYFFRPILCVGCPSHGNIRVLPTTLWFLVFLWLE